MYECSHCGKVYSNHLSFVKHVQVHEIEAKQKLEEIEKSRTKEENDVEVSFSFTNFHSDSSKKLDSLMTEKYFECLSNYTAFQNF